MGLLFFLLYYLVNLNIGICTKKASYNIKLVSQLDGILLECPQWSTDENVLYFSDVMRQKIYRFDPDTGNIQCRDIDYGKTSIVIPVKNAPGTLLVAVRSELYFLKWGAPGRDQALRQLTAVDFGKPKNNINDGKVDAKGRLFFGTVGEIIDSDAVPDQATLYSLDYKSFKTPEVQIRPVTISNGIAWSHDNSKMFYTDSPTRTIMSFDYILETGEISNDTILFNFDDYNLPGEKSTTFGDGMTIDVDGNLWVATLKGARILKIDSQNGKLLDQILFPVDQVTSVIWGGKDFSTLYVTTGRLATEDPLPSSGSLFAITNTGTKGKPEPKFIFPGASKY